MGMNIPLTQGQFALVDAGDYERINQRKWHAVWSEHIKSFYAARMAPTENGKRRRIWMHREVLGLAFDDPRKGDHVDPSLTLDNQRANLRIATRAENMQNRRLFKNSTSGFKGVSWHKHRRLWAARIWTGGKSLALGYHATPEDAHAAYCAAAAKHQKEFARTR